MAAASRTGLLRLEMWLVQAEMCHEYKTRLFSNVATYRINVQKSVMVQRIQIDLRTQKIPLSEKERGSCEKMFQRRHTAKD